MRGEICLSCENKLVFITIKFIYGNFITMVMVNGKFITIYYHKNGNLQGAYCVLAMVLRTSHILGYLTLTISMRWVLLHHLYS